MDTNHRRLDWLLPDWLENVGAFGQSANEDMSTVLFTIIVNVLIFLLCFICFIVFRMHFPKVFQPKPQLYPERKIPPLPHDSLFGWILPLLMYTEEDIIKISGYDCLFLIRFYQLAFKIIAVFCLYGWGVLLPINRFGGASDDSNSFDAWSMTNILQASERCWYHLGGIYLLTIITIYFLEKEFVVYAKYRHEYLRQRNPRLRTVLVEGIPYKMRSNVTLATYFEALYPNAIVSVRLAQDLSVLDDLVNQRQAVVEKLERLYYRKRNGERSHNITDPDTALEVDAIQYYTDQLKILNDRVHLEQEASRRLALKQDRQSGTSAYSVIEEFLHVTQIGTLKKMLKNKSGSSKKWLRPRASDSEFSGDLDADSPVSSDVVHSQSSERREFVRLESSVSQLSFDVYKLSWPEWFRAFWQAPTMYDRWRLLKDGRLSELHNPTEERVSLISPPEERRLFLSKAFVTFKTFTAATVARQVIHMQLADHLVVTEAPEPTDIIWRNIYTSRKGIFYRRVFVEAAIIALNIAWVAPVSIISYLISEQALRSEFEIIDRLCTNSVWFESLIQFLQPTALVWLMYALPPILNGLGLIEGYIAHSNIQFRTFDRYFFFQIINVFLVTTIAGSVIDCVSEIYFDPSAAFELLGSSLPKMGGFFTNYIIIKAFMGLGMEIVRLTPFLISFLKILTPNLTPREKRSTPLWGGIRGMDYPGWFPFSKIYAQDMLQVVLCLVYANISPVILYAGLCYFGIASVVYKHQLLYVYEPLYETGGKWWPKMAKCFVVGLILAQATLVGMFILKETYNELSFMAVLLGFTVLYYWNITKIYVPLANQLPYDMAVSMDYDQELSAHETLLQGSEVYVQPSLRAGLQQPELDFDIETLNARKDHHSNLDASESAALV